MTASSNASWWCLRKISSDWVGGGSKKWSRTGDQTNMSPVERASNGVYEHPGNIRRPARETDLNCPLPSSKKCFQHPPPPTSRSPPLSEVDPCGMMLYEVRGHGGVDMVYPVSLETSVVGDTAHLVDWMSVGISDCCNALEQ